MYIRCIHSNVCCMLHYVQCTICMSHILVGGHVPVYTCIYLSSKYDSLISLSSSSFSVVAIVIHGVAVNTRCSKLRGQGLWHLEHSEGASRLTTSRIHQDGAYDLFRVSVRRKWPSSHHHVSFSYFATASLGC